MLALSPPNRPAETVAEPARGVERLIVEAEREGLLEEPRGLTGLSGDKLVGLLQRLHRYQCERGAGAYLEVGVFQGLSLVSVAVAHATGRAFGIDNFRQYDAEGKNQALVARRAADNGVADRVVLLNDDFEDALADLGARTSGVPVATYFVDGPHDYRSQLLCLTLGLPWLAPGAVIVVDDSNYRHVRLANRDFLTLHPDFKLLFEAYTPTHPDHATDGQLASARAGWWNGVNVLVHDPLDRLPRRFPPTLRDRSLFFNDHEVHSARSADYAVGALKLLDASLEGDEARAGDLVTRIRKRVSSEPSPHRGEHATANVHSEDLPAFRLCTET
jgi:predicted O-methyltransferase YrrM